MIVNEDITLIEFLLKKTDYSKSKIKSLLKHDIILLNGKIVNRDVKLKVNDKIEFTSSKIANNNLNILYEDKYIIVVNKKSGLLTISTDKEKEKTLYNLVSEYVKKSNKNNRIFIVHRLDKDTAGIIIYAKNEKIKQILQKNWGKIILKRGYTAICEGIFSKKKGTVKNYLTENSNNFVYITDSTHGKLAITNYEVIKFNNKYSLVKVYIDTGRKNQIRVHMKSLNHPIVGDKKYGNKSSNKLCLIADELEFIHPVTNKKMRFKLDIPINFTKLVK